MTAYRNLPAVEPGAPLELHAAAVEDGAIVLAALPGLAVPLDAAGGGAPLAGPAGATADAAGAVYLSDPDGDRILVLGPCDTEPVALPCVRGGSDPGSVRAPGGLAVDARGALYIADRGNDRVQCLDPASGTVLAVLGPADPYAPPGAEGLFHEPTDVALDAAGRLYVADRGHSRVIRVDLPARSLDAPFAATLAAQPRAPRDPTHVAVALLAGVERLIVLDAADGLLAYDLDGAQDDALCDAFARALVAAGAGAASTVATADGRILVGDPAGRRVLAFDELGRFAGTVPGYRGPTVALALDRRGRLVVATGAEVLRLDAAGRAQEGTFVLGPLAAGGEGGWHLVRARCDPPPAGAHLRLSTFTAASADASPAEWTAAPVDQLDVRVPASAGRYLWIRGALSGTGTATAAVRSLQVSWDHDGWWRWLPAVYAREAAGETLDGLLALLEGGLDEQEETIAALAERFDPATAPDDDRAGRWLDWLAGWQALELDARWAGGHRRRAVRGAFAANGRRGTPGGLRDAIGSALDIHASIVEPATAAELWRLGDDHGPLGVQTMLAAAEADGAVLGRTATLGRSELIEAGEEGTPLFADLAHRFCVQVHAGELAADGARDALVALVDRERPAHTAWSLRVIEPRARVGVQSRLGIDAVVARPADPLTLGPADGPGLGDTTLGRGPAASRVGERAHLGVDANVS